MFLAARASIAASRRRTDERVEGTRFANIFSVQSFCGECFTFVVISVNDTIVIKWQIKFAHFTRCSMIYSSAIIQHGAKWPIK